MKTKTLIAAILLLTIPSFLVASQSARKMISENPHLALGNLYPYHPQDTSACRAPRGYEIFYLSHFGRHGSRYGTDSMEVVRLADKFLAYHEEGRLSERGEQLYQDILTIQRNSAGRFGSLSSLGAAEHRQIAARMARHYPQLFTPGKRIDSYSSHVQRVIDSRDNFISSLGACCPGLEIHMGCSKDDSRSAQEVFGRGLSQEQNALMKERQTANRVREKVLGNFDCSAFSSTIFTDPIDDGKTRRLMRSILSATKSCLCMDGNMPDITQYFSNDELYWTWWGMNLDWYLNHAETADNKGAYAMAKGKGIMEMVIEDALAVIDGRSDASATLRFGHDGDINGIQSFLAMEGANASDLELIADQAKDFVNVRTAVNLQFIFCRNKKGDVLVKVLRNEKETRLEGLRAHKGGFYRWEDLKAFCEGK